MKKNPTYPKYYNVDDIPIIIELEGDEVAGYSGNGQPYPLGKAVIDGHEISRAEYLKLRKELYNLD
ncbi:hypothetical protein A3F57_03115 [Candidatus Roizmanbacteria bacterium RIFCSPHIGHO2_12_FULL_36_11]|uniref:Uncharacterized protein n=1 Tax=Candidatus Curtissbacteria bacterium RIFCSPLOWO2_01_FULL_37_9 TaxID=1797724 RepID=A0A1F5GUM5_9BACT|nr:MAG: hypothetical protein A3A48_03610 [Candidatus Curtissbacteria bacterium RIFCSPLOWO2_01_FULL_37_9]OGK32553.1 MAG: hypothetical protein A3F57_03115 [Candidatus Roizmanbacteria bacterium RIFCSPHIGHO2_12_FULL_36_11]